MEHGSRVCGSGVPQPEEEEEEEEDNSKDDDGRMAMVGNSCDDGVQ